MTIEATSKEKQTAISCPVKRNEFLVTTAKASESAMAVKNEIQKWLVEMPEHHSTEHYKQACKYLDMAIEVLMRGAATSQGMERHSDEFLDLISDVILGRAKMKRVIQSVK